MYSTKHTQINKNEPFISAHIVMFPACVLKLNIEGIPTQLHGFSEG